VLIDARHDGLPSVVIDDVAGGALATRHLIDLGHRRTSVAVGRPAEGLLFARTFPGGGHDLSRALATEFQVPLAEADWFKLVWPADGDLGAPAKARRPG
jgi:Tfp pilus assembly PilM family ATPase